MYKCLHPPCKNLTSTGNLCSQKCKEEQKNFYAKIEKELSSKEWIKSEMTLMELHKKKAQEEGWVTILEEKEEEWITVSKDEDKENEETFSLHESSCDIFCYGKFERVDSCASSRVGKSIQTNTVQNISKKTEEDDETFFSISEKNVSSLFFQERDNFTREWMNEPTYVPEIILETKRYNMYSKNLYRELDTTEHSEIGGHEEPNEDNDNELSAEELERREKMVSRFDHPLRQRQRVII